jgi:hypothetical protein
MRSQDKIRRHSTAQALACHSTYDLPILSHRLHPRPAKARLDNGDAKYALLEMEEAVTITASVLAPTSYDLVKFQDTLVKCRAALGQ